MTVEKQPVSRTLSEDPFPSPTRYESPRRVMGTGWEPDEFPSQQEIEEAEAAYVAWLEEQR